MALDRRQFLTGTGVAAAAAATGGCAGLTGKAGGDSSGAGSGAQELTFLNWSGDTEKKAFDDLIGRFQQANPGITIKTETVPYASVQSTLDARFSSGKPPDLFRVSYIDIGQYTSQDVLLDLSAAFDQAAVNAFVPGLWQAIVHEDKPYGVPHQIDTTAILYRKDAFSAAGITKVPSSTDDAWSWDEFASIAAKLKTVVKGKQVPFTYDWQLAGAYRWLSWLFQAGGTMLGEDLRTPAVDSDQGRRAVEFTQSFFTKGWVARNTSTKSSTYPDNAFIAGTVAMAFAGDFLVPSIESGLKGKVEYGSLPMPRDVAAASDLGGNALVAAKDGQHTDAAAAFLTFASSEEQMKRYCEATGQLPTRTALTTASLDFAVRPDLMDVFVQQATTITADQVKQVTVPQFGKINAALADELDAAFIGGRQAQATVSALAAAIADAAR